MEYHLKSHRRDELIEWIKALLVVPFVLIRELPSTERESRRDEALVRERYAEVLKDVEELIEDHSTISNVKLIQSLNRNKTPQCDQN